MKICSAYLFILMQIKLIHFKSFAQPGLILKQRHKVNSEMAYSVSES